MSNTEGRIQDILEYMPQATSRTALLLNEWIAAAAGFGVKGIDFRGEAWTSVPRTAAHTATECSLAATSVIWDDT